jgi:hypothetical protein
LLAKRREVLGGAARVEVELALEVSYRAFPVGEQLEDPDPHRMSEDSEELGLDDVDGV